MFLKAAFKLSGPGDLCGLPLLQLEKGFITPWRVIFISGIDGYGNIPLSGILLKSSTVKTELKTFVKKFVLF